MPGRRISRTEGTLIFGGRVKRSLHPYYAGYVSHVPEGDIMSMLEEQAAGLRLQTGVFITGTYIMAGHVRLIFIS